MGLWANFVRLEEVRSQAIFDELWDRLNDSDKQE